MEPTCLPLCVTMSLCQLNTKPCGSQSRDRLGVHVLPCSPRDLEPCSSGQPFLDRLPLALLLTPAPFQTSFQGRAPWSSPIPAQLVRLPPFSYSKISNGFLSSLKINAFLSYFMHMGILPTCMSVLYVFLVPVVVRRRCWRTLRVTDGCEPPCRC